MGSRPLPACGSVVCRTSSGIHGHDDGVSDAYPGRYPGLTFGSGRLDEFGYWEHPCAACARAHEAARPEDGPCWPFAAALVGLAATRSHDLARCRR